MTTRARWLVAAACCVAAFVGVYVLAVRTAWGQTIDIWLFAQVQTGSVPAERIAGWLRAGLPVVLAGTCAILAVVAARSGRWRAILAACAVVAVSVPSATILRTSVLMRPFLGENGYVENTMPSGHVAVTAALAVAAVLLAPARARVFVGLAGAAVTLVACAVSVVGHAHRPSDTVASLLLVGAVTCAVVGLVLAGRREPHGLLSATSEGNR